LKRKKTYTGHPKRLLPAIKNKIVLLKENTPSLTLFEAQKALDEKGVKVSIHGIWRIWKKYNLAGFRRNDVQSVKAITSILEVEYGSRKAEQALNKGDVKEAAQILNALPCCAGRDILKRIPDRFLLLRRRVEKLEITFDETPFCDTLRKARILRKKAEKKGFLYLSVLAGIAELFAMEWTARSSPGELLSRVNQLQSRLQPKYKCRDNTNFTLRFDLLDIKVRALSRLARIKEALSCIKKYETICRHHPCSSSYRNIASLYSTIHFHRRARSWIEKSLRCNEGADKSLSHLVLAANLSIAGEYQSARKILGKQNVGILHLHPLVSIVNAYCFLGNGEIQDAAKAANKALSESKKLGIFDYYCSSSSMLAYCSCALNKKEEAETLMRRTIPLLKKLKVKRDLFFHRLLSSRNYSLRNAILMPNIKLAFLLRQASKSLKVTDYRKAYNYANSQRLMGLFHRLVLFFPESVSKLILKGKPTGLPKGLLRLPVFQKNISAYYLKFLGSVSIYRNGIRLRQVPTPIYASFIIHLGFEKRIELNSLYRNFWSHAKNPRDSLSHLSFGLRRYLRLPPNTLFIKQGFLNFKGYFTTDYQEFEQTMIRAKALERAGEWGFAKKEYLRAFKLFHGEPFKKMYDPWSENMRRVILNNLETEAIHFAKSCLEHKNNRDAKKVLQKVAEIIPQSEEIKELLGGSIIG
jgi:tetratricopeptide (TPR) repeat protein